jgi:hypothetical protein
VFYFQKTDLFSFIEEKCDSLIHTKHSESKDFSGVSCEFVDCIFFLRPSVLFSQYLNRIANGLLHDVSFFLALVWPSRPEESLEAIFPPARHDVRVQMRHALTNAVIDRYKGAVGLERSLDRAGEQLHIAEERSDQVLGQVRQSFVVAFGNQQAMSRKNRAMIEKSQ